MNNLIKQINELYGLGVHSSERVTKGFLSENHILFHGDKKYFLKRYRFDNKEKIEEIHSVKKYFAEGGIPIILPIIHKEGNTFFFFNRGYFALFPFVEGKHLERGLLSDTATVSFGETLGRMHLLGKKSTLPVKKKLGLNSQEKALEIIKEIESRIKGKKELDNFDELAIKNIEMKKRLMLSNPFTEKDLELSNDHLTHGDYLNTNVFFDDNDKVSSVFDLEKVRYAPRAHELFRSLNYCFLDGEITKKKLRKAGLYLDSYLKIYPMSKAEISMGLKLFYLTLIRGLWVENEHYLKNNNRVDEFLLKDFERIKYLSENFNELENELL